MRKLSVVLVAIAGLGLTAIALAVTNTYQVVASTSPTTAGSGSKPVPVSLTFSYLVGEETNQRPSPVKQYQIKIDGLRVNTKPFKTCTAHRINAAGSNASCPAAAVVGTGSVDSRLGPTNNPSSQSLHCYLALTLYNAPNNHATLFLKGQAVKKDQD